MGDFSLKRADFRVVITDSVNDRIVKRILKESLFTQSNQADMGFVDEIGSYGTTDDCFKQPHGIAMTDNYIVVVDSYNNRLVKRLSSDLSFVLSLGSYGSGNDNFKAPDGVCISHDNQYVFVCDSYNHRIFKRLLSDFTYVSKIGSYGTSGNDYFYHPAGICVSPDNKYIYVVDRWNHRIVKRSAVDLSYVTEVGSYGSGEEQFNYPWGIDATPDGEYLIIADRNNNRIVKYTADDLAFVEEIGTLGSGDNQFYFPTGLKIMLDGKYFVVVDQGNNRIVKREISDLSYIAKFGSVGSGNDNFQDPYDVAFWTNNQYCIVTDGFNARIKKHYAYYRYMFQDIVYEDEAGTSGSGDDEMDNPTGIAISQDNESLIICDKNNNRVLKYSFETLEYETKVALVNAHACVIDPTNTYVYVIDSTATTGKIRKYNLSDLSLAATSSGSYDQLNGIAITPDGSYLLISEVGTDKVYKVDAATLIDDSSIGSTGSGDDQFSGPAGIATDGTSFVVADSGNDRIVKRLVSDLSYDSQVGTTGSEQNEFNAPTDITITPDFLSILVTDSNNDRIVRRKFSDLSYISQIGEAGSGDDSFDTPLAIACTTQGINKIVTISEPAANYLYDKLVKYLPAFVDINELMTAILKGVEAPLLTAKKRINASTTYALKNFKYQDVRLLQLALESILFLNGSESDIEIQYFSEIQEVIHSRRGTLVGLRDDLIRMTGDKAVSVEEVAENQSGWWAGISYPCIDAEGNFDPNATSSWAGCIDQINIQASNEQKRYSAPLLNQIVSEYLIPAHVIAHLKLQPLLTWYIAVNDDGDGLDLSRISI